MTENNTKKVEQTIINSQVPVTIVNTMCSVNTTKHSYSRTVIDKEYGIGKKLSNISAGEAEIYLCKKRGEEGYNYIIKIYNRSEAIKSKVLDCLKRINSPFIPKIVKEGKLDNKSYIIMPYYKYKSFRNYLNLGKTLNLERIKIFVENMNEALKVLHDNGIIHKDIKPDNIMISDEGYPVIIDFGISSFKDNNETVLITKTGMTPSYLALEAVSGCYSDMSDYYSLGITIYELFVGHTPYANLAPEEAASMAAIQKIPFDKDFPEELKSLILGLTYSDISNRHDKNNPNCRWGYDELKNWLKGVEQPIPGAATSLQSSKIATTFLKQKYTDSKELLHALMLNWNDGIKFLGRGTLTDFFTNNNDEISANICDDAYNNIEKYNKNYDAWFCATMYKLQPSLTQLCWKGYFFDDLTKYGQSLITEANLLLAGKNGNKTIVNSAIELLENKIIFSYAEHNHPFGNKSFISLLKQHLKLKQEKPLDNIGIALRLGYSLTNTDSIVIAKRRFESIKSLSDYVQNLFDTDLPKYIIFKKKFKKQILEKANFFVGQKSELLLNIFHEALEFKNVDIAFRNWNEFNEYVKSLWDNSELMELWTFYKKIKPELASLKNMEKQKGNSSNIRLECSHIESYIKRIYKFDEYFFKSESDFSDYLEKLKLSSSATFTTFCNAHRSSYNKYLQNKKV